MGRKAGVEGAAREGSDAGRRSRSRVVGLAVVTLFAAACAGGTSEGAPPRSVQEPAVEYKAERQVLELVNRERQAAALSPLPWNSRAAEFAREYSSELSAVETAGGIPASEDAIDRVLVARSRDVLALRTIALVRDPDEVHRVLMNSPDGRAALLSSAALDAGIGIAFGGKASGRVKLFITVVLRTLPDTAFVAAGASPADDAPAAPSTASTESPQTVPPTMIEGARVYGSKNIVPDDDTKDSIWRARQSKLVGSYKVCITIDGAVTSVRALKLTGFPAYDLKIIQELWTWRYRPYTVNGKSVPVCTAVTFIYRQR